MSRMAHPLGFIVAFFGDTVFLIGVSTVSESFCVQAKTPYRCLLKFYIEFPLTDLWKYQVLFVLKFLSLCHY